MEKSQRRQTIATSWQKHMECEWERGDGHGAQDRNATEALNQCINQLLVDVSLCRQKMEEKIFHFALDERKMAITLLWP